MTSHINSIFCIEFRYAPSYMYDEQYYPNYLSGAGYVMSMDVAAKLYNASLSIPLFHLEDVYLTGLNDLLETKTKTEKLYKTKFDFK